MRFSLNDAGPILLSRLLELNSTQESHLSLAFAYARKSRIRLAKVGDLLSVLDEMIAREERGISKSSVSVIERKLLSLQESGLDAMFGEPSVSLDDLGGLNVLNLSDSRKNMLVSIAPAFVLQKLFNELPEVGDVERPRFAVFFDEAHYLFRDSNKSLRDLIVTILKQIRSKGVSVFFITQDVADLPDDVLSQLATKIIFAQRVASAKGEAGLRALSKSFPKTGEFDLVEELKALPPGTAMVTTLDPSGNQTKPARVAIFAPATTMDVLDYATLRKATDPRLLQKYRQKASLPQLSVKPVLPPARQNPPPTLQKAKAVAGENKTAGKAGPSFTDALFGFLLKLLRFLLDALGMVASAVIIRPLWGLFRYLVKKPVRLLWFLLLLLILYVIIVNWALAESLLSRLKLS
jgi:hypothetical protein